MKDHGQNERKLLGRTEGVLGSGNPMVPISPVEMDPQGSEARRHRRGMRPAVGIRPVPQRVNNELTDEVGKTKVMPLSVEAEEFSLRTGPRRRVTAGAGSDGIGDYLPSRTGPGKIAIRCDAVVPTTAEVWAAALADTAGAVALVDRAGTNVSAVAGMKFSAVAEVHSSAIDDEGDPSVIRTSRQWSAVVLDPMAAPRKDCGPMHEMSDLEPLKHSVLEVSLEGGDRSVKEVAMPYQFEHSGMDRAADLISEMSVQEPLEHSVLEVPLEVGDVSVDSMTVLDPLEHSGVSVHAEPLSAYLPRMHSEESRNEGGDPRDHPGEDSTFQDLREEVKQAPPEDGEAIVVGAVGSAAPWFLTGWAEDMEVEFMIDTGCQVTILATSVFERMCAADPQVRSRLRPCGRRLVSADSSPLTLKGELELNVVFPGLSCDMLFVVDSIGSDGLLGTEALQSCLPHQLDLRTGQLWTEGRSTLQLHQQRLIPEVQGFLMTSVVLPPDREIVAPFSVSGVRL